MRKKDQQLTEGAMLALQYAFCRGFAIGFTTGFYQFYVPTADARCQASADGHTLVCGENSPAATEAWERERQGLRPAFTFKAKRSRRRCR